MDNLLRLLKNMKPNISVVIFTSPQTLTDKFPSFVGDLQKQVSFVVVDEIHMFNSFGRSFRKEFSKLKGKLFRKVDKLTPMLFLTATCNKQIKRHHLKI